MSSLSVLTINASDGPTASGVTTNIHCMSLASTSGDCYLLCDAVHAGVWGVPRGAYPSLSGCAWIEQIAGGSPIHVPL